MPLKSDRVPFVIPVPALFPARHFLARPEIPLLEIAWPRSATERVPYSIAEFHSVPDSKLGFDELDPVTQSGNVKMLRRGDWKLLFDMLGNGELYNLAADAPEIENLFQIHPLPRSEISGGRIAHLDHPHARRSPACRL
jgi:hypothetical protein